MNHSKSPEGPPRVRMWRGPVALVLWPAAVVWLAVGVAVAAGGKREGPADILLHELLPPRPSGAVVVQPTVPESGPAAAALWNEEFAELWVRALAARKDKLDLAPLAVALETRLPRVELYVLEEFSQAGVEAAPYWRQVEALLGRKEEAVRAAAAAALGRMEEPAAVGGLLARLSGDPSVAVRSAAARALGQLRQESAAPGLVRALSDGSPEVRGKAVLALARLKWERAGGPIAERLQADADEAVRELAAQALGELGAKEWVGALSQALAHDESPRVRLNAAVALGQLKARDALDRLVAALDDEDAQVREAAVAALSQLADVRAIAPLQRLFDRSADSAETALASRAWEALLTLAQDDSAVLWKLAAARRQAGDPDRAREACRRLVERFGEAEEAAELWPARVLLAALLSTGPNGEQGESLLRQALTGLEAGLLTEEQVSDLEGLVAGSGPLRERLMEALAEVLAAGGRGGAALEVLDELAALHPEQAELWWGRRYLVVSELARAGRWAEVEGYLKKAAGAAESYGGSYHERLAATARQAAAVLDETSSADLVARWLGAGGGAAAVLQARIRGRGLKALGALVDALEDPQSAARQRAAALLRELSGQQFAFDPEGEDEARAQAIARWRAWLAQAERATEAAGKGDVGSGAPSPSPAPQGAGKAGPAERAPGTSEE